MNAALESFAAACKYALQTNEGKAGRDAICDLVRNALKDEVFVESTVMPESDERKILFEDPDLGFCICVHTYDGAKEGAPHDHGPTWAIYGQAEGETEMTDWEVVAPATEGKPARVKQVRSYTMVKGDAHLYEPGDIHAPLRRGPVRLLRIEGENTEHVQRTPITRA